MPSGPSPISDLTERLRMAIDIVTFVNEGLGHSSMRDGDVVTVGRYRLEVIATPGHTPDRLADLLRGGRGTSMSA